jgi:hypothetical protein
MFEALKDYKTIGWDFDDTLIDHPNSRAFWRFIEHNPYGQDHFIVTFRSGGLETRIFNDLMIRGSRLEQVHFTAVHSIPHELWRDYHLEPARGGLITTLDDDPYLVWKGMTCAEHGIEVLIDDMTHNVLRGCRKHAIDYFHPDDLG